MIDDLASQSKPFLQNVNVQSFKNMLHDPPRFSGRKDHNRRTIIFWPTRWSSLRTLEFAVLVLLCLLFLVWLAFPITQSISTSFTGSATLSAGQEHLWAQYSPYFPAAKYQPLPQGCNVSQVSKADEKPSIDVTHLCSGQHCMFSCHLFCSSLRIARFNGMGRALQLLEQESSSKFPF
jgi:hypothetical protein